MQKFTIFTVFTAIIVLSLVFEISSGETQGDDFAANVARENFGEREFKKSFGQEERALPEEPPVEEKAPESEPEPEKAPATKPDPEKSSEPSSEKPYHSDKLTQTIRQISAVFSYEPEQFGGKVFQLIEITDLPLEGAVQGNWQNQGVIEAVVYEMPAADEVMAAEVYQLIRKKTALYPDISVNETNKYGDGSLYINHARKPNEAFLVVRVKKTVYAFAYGKTFHDNIEKLITLLTLT